MSRSVGAGARRALRDGTRGQATVELVGLLPVVIGLVLGVAQLLAAGLARELADHAAEAGAVALLEGADPVDAARRSLPEWAREDLSVNVHGRRVSVAVRAPSPSPALAERLAARATADAGGDP